MQLQSLSAMNMHFRIKINFLLTNKDEVTRPVLSRKCCFLALEKLVGKITVRWEIIQSRR